MSRVYAIEVKDTPFYREGGVDRYRVLRQGGLPDRYEVKIYLGGRDLHYVSAATYWLPPVHKVAGTLEHRQRLGQGRFERGHTHMWGDYELAAAAGLGPSVAQTVDRSWRNPDCSLTIWTTKVFTLAVQVALKNGQIIRTRHRLTFNEDFRTRVLRPQDTVHHENAMVSFGVETPASMVEPAPHEADAFTVETPKTMEAGS